MLGLKGLQQVENHVNGQTHISNYSFRLSNTHRKDMCTACGVAFNNKVAFEAHLLMPSHAISTSTLPKAYPPTPNVDELLRHLSGLPFKHFTPEVSCVCNPCNVECDSLDGVILHMFTSMHISRLKWSKCIVCKKEFSHPVNSNDHLSSSKHTSTLQKCSNRLDEWRSHSRLMKGGFSCVYCMLWYSSWHCMELHLCSEQHTKAKGGLSSPLVECASTNLNNGPGEVCDDAVIRNWKEWREDELMQQAWCHRCGLSVSSLDLGCNHLKEVHHLEERFDTPQSEQDGHTCLAHRSQANGEVMDHSLLSEIFLCRVCALSFKSALLLSAHEASFEHHCRLESALSSNGHQYCASCGVVLRQTDGDRCRVDTQQPLPDDGGNQLSFLTMQKSESRWDGQSLLDNSKSPSMVKFNLPNAIATVTNPPTKHEQNVLPLNNGASHTAAGESNPGGQRPVAVNRTSYEALTVEDPVEVFKTQENSFMPKSMYTDFKAPLTMSREIPENETTFSCLASDVAPVHQKDNIGKGEGEHHAYEVEKLQDCLGNISGHVEHSPAETLGAKFHSPIYVVQGFAPFHSLSEAIDTMMAKLSEALLSALPTSLQQLAESNSLKHKSVDEIAQQHVAKRVCDLNRRPHCSLSLDVAPSAHDSCQELLTAGIYDNDGKDSKALLLLSASIPLPDLGGSFDLDGQMVGETQKGLPTPTQREHLSEEPLRSSCEKLQSQYPWNTCMIDNTVHAPGAISPCPGSDEGDAYVQCSQFLEDLEDTSDWWRLVSDLDDSTDSEMQS
ncbi:hypothetical protein L7F22_021105 [Adiantum nelumboides]|nr:hypothetical protein [Adiantum nelumboides]